MGFEAAERFWYWDGLWVYFLAAGRQADRMWSYSTDLLYDIVRDYIFKHQVNMVPRRAQHEHTFILSLQEVTFLENSVLCNTTSAGCKTVMSSVQSLFLLIYLFLLFCHFGNSWLWSESKITKVPQSFWCEMFSQIFRAVFHFPFKVNRE